tara:strand:+ start:3266 stop:3664 length:399 start_codon:yes stop_codon:yes gene_type:complete
MRNGGGAEGKSSFGGHFAVFKDSSHNGHAPSLDAALIDKWENRPLILLIANPTEKEEEITALLDRPELRQRFLDDPNGALLLYNLATIQSSKYCDAILASTICDHNAGFKRSMMAVKETTRHQCCAPRSSSP